MYLCRLSYLKVWARKQGEEQDFETFARVTLDSLKESVNAIKSEQDQMMTDFKFPLWTSLGFGALL